MSESIDPMTEALARIKELETHNAELQSLCGLQELCINELENDPMRLPELPDGWMYEVYGHGNTWACRVLRISDVFRAGVVIAFGDSPRAAALAAIAKIGGAE